MSFTIGREAGKFVPIKWLDGNNGAGMSEYEATEACRMLNEDPEDGGAMDAAPIKCGDCGSDMVPLHVWKCTKTICGNTVQGGLKP